MIRTDNNNRIHRVLWTGGLDSTYRMIELALQDTIVEPVYVVNDGRRSRNIELAAMQSMLELLRDAKRFRAVIKDIRIINKADIEVPFEIHEAYERLHQSYDIGSQYEWLAALSKTIDNLEICIENAPEGRLRSRDVIIQSANHNRTGDDLRLINDANIIFGDFILPIFDRTEEEMLAAIEGWGCDDIIRNIWFCNHPLIIGCRENGIVGADLQSGERYCPCGLCHPCRIKIESGMKHLLPQSALSRYETMSDIASSRGEEAARDYRMNIWIDCGLPLK